MWMGIDIGTGGTRALLVDAQGRVHGGFTAPHEDMRMERPLWAEQRPENWWDAARQAIRATHVRDEVVVYVQQLLTATRQDDSLAVGASPRSGLMLLMGAKGLARFAGRDFVTPDDVQTAFLPALRHRVVLTATTELEGTTTDEVLAQLLETVEVPR